MTRNAIEMHRMALTYNINTVKNLIMFVALFLNRQYIHIIQNSKSVNVYAQNCLPSQSPPPKATNVTKFCVVFQRHFMHIKRCVCVCVHIILFDTFIQMRMLDILLLCFFHLHLRDLCITIYEKLPHSFLQLINTSLAEYSIIYLITSLLMDIYFLSNLLPLQTTL